MRIGIVCPYSLDVPGGVQNHVKDLAEALIALGHDVSVLAPSESGGPAAVRRAAPGGRSRCPTTARWRGCRSARSRRPAPGAGCRDGDFDVLHLHEPATPEPVAAGAVGRRVPGRGDLPLRRTSAPGPCRRRAADPAPVAGEGRAPGSRSPRTPAAPRSATSAGSRWSSPTACTSTGSRRRRRGEDWRGRPGHGRVRGPLRRAPQGLRGAGGGVRRGGRRPPGLRLLVVGGGDVDAGPRGCCPPSVRDQVRFLGPRRRPRRRRRRCAPPTSTSPPTPAGRASASCSSRRWPPAPRVLASDIPAVPPGARRRSARRAVPEPRTPSDLAERLADAARRPRAAGVPATPRPPWRVRRYDWSAVAERDPARLRDGRAGAVR